MMSVLMIACLVVLVVTLAGCVAFIAVYRPLWPWAHDVYGRNLLLLCWWLGLLIIVALANFLVRMPPLLGTGLQLISFTGIAYVVWQRVFLVPRARREARIEAEGGDPMARNRAPWYCRMFTWFRICRKYHR